jgi:hypothetical protein
MMINQSLYNYYLFTYNSRPSFQLSIQSLSVTTNNSPSAAGTVSLNQAGTWSYTSFGTGDTIGPPATLQIIASDTDYPTGPNPQGPLLHSASLSSIGGTLESYGLYDDQNVLFGSGVASPSLSLSASALPLHHPCRSIWTQMHFQ